MAIDADRVGLLARQVHLDEYPAKYLTASYLNHTRVPDLYASCVILTVLAITATVLRGMARRKTRVKLAVDDYMIMLGSVITSKLSLEMCQQSDDNNLQVFFTALTLMIIIDMHRTKLGQHYAPADEADYSEFWKVRMQSEEAQSLARSCSLTRES